MGNVLYCSREEYYFIRKNIRRGTNVGILLLYLRCLNKLSYILSKENIISSCERGD